MSGHMQICNLENNMFVYMFNSFEATYNMFVYMFNSFEAQSGTGAFLRSQRKPEN